LPEAGDKLERFVIANKYFYSVQFNILFVLGPNKALSLEWVM